MMSDDKPDSPPEQRAPGAEPQAPDTGKSAWAEQGQAAELEALRAEAAELKDRLLRTMAEMENLRRRTEREKSDTAKYAISAFARDVLTVADNIGRAIEAVPQEALADDAALKALLDGVQVTERELLNALERHGIQRLAPAGERFDPHLHQAMLEVERKDVPAGTVVDVLQPGYVIEERVLRPALVSVAKGGPKASREEDAPSKAANNNLPKDDDGDGGAEPRGGDRDGEGSGKGKKNGGRRIGGRVDRSA